MSEDKKQGYEKPLKLDMDMNKAMEKFVKVTKEEVEEQQHYQGEFALEGETHFVLFKKKEIRQIFHDNEWHFSIVDVVEALTGSDRPSKYWNDLKRQLTNKEAFSEISDKIGKLPMPTADGKMRDTEVVNTETLFRVVQSIPSKNAEPFKKWLAKVGYERIQEFQDPEIAIKRAILTYKAKGHDDEWINKRIQTILSRKDLTHEWQKRGIKEGFQYALLTDAISEGTFDLKTKEHREIKSLKSHHNLRDHMSPLELALTMLGETTTAELARTKDAQGFTENKDAASLGGKVAGGARKNIEQKLGKNIVTGQNFLPKSRQKKLL